MDLFLNLLILLVAFSIPVMEVVRRCLVVAKYKSMFPGRKLEFAPPLFEIDFRKVPFNEKGNKFINWYKRLSRVGLAFCVTAFALVYLLGQLR